MDLSLIHIFAILYGIKVKSKETSDEDAQG